MTLRDFLHKFRVKQKDFAEAVGVSDATLSSYVTGRVIPTLAVALAIEKAAAGWVKPHDWGVTVSGVASVAGTEITEEKMFLLSERILTEIDLVLSGYCRLQECQNFVTKVLTHATRYPV